MTCYTFFEYLSCFRFNCFCGCDIVLRCCEFYCLVSAVDSVTRALTSDVKKNMSCFCAMFIGCFDVIVWWPLLSSFNACLCHIDTLVIDKINFNPPIASVSLIMYIASGGE